MRTALYFLAASVFPMATQASSFNCGCSQRSCTNDNPSIEVSYDLKTQFFNVVGSAWEVSGYFTKQTSRATQRIFVTFPEAATFSKMTVELDANGDLPGFQMSGFYYACSKQ